MRRSLLLFSASLLMCSTAAMAQSSLQPLGSRAQPGNDDPIILPAKPSTATATAVKGNNFTFVPRSAGAAAMPIPQPVPQPVQPSLPQLPTRHVEAPKPVVAPVPVATPAPAPMAQAPSTKMLPPDTKLLEDGQTLHGNNAHGAAFGDSGFYAMTAKSQAQFVDIWKNHIGEEPPALVLPQGYVAVFATTGRKAYTGYGVTLKMAHEGEGRIQIAATEVRPSPLIAQERADISPWEILVVRADGAKVEVLQGKALSGPARAVEQ